MKDIALRNGLRITLALACMALPALAKENQHPIDAWLDRELKKDLSTLGQRKAINAASEKRDADMNKQYNLLMQKLPPADRPAVKKAQRAWLAYRDADIEATRHVVGKLQGTMWLVVGDDRRMQVIKDRALLLEGDVADTSER